MRTSDTRTSRARKDHACDMCGRAIQKGTLYASWSCFLDDGVGRVKAHQTCDAIGHMIDLDDVWTGAPPLSDLMAVDVWNMAEGLDLVEIAAVWGTKEEAVAEAERRRGRFWSLMGFGYNAGENY